MPRRPIWPLRIVDNAPGRIERDERPAQVTVGAPGQELTAASVAAPPVEVEGVLPKAGYPMSTVIGTVAGMAMAEAGFNLFQGLAKLGVPTIPAAGMPVLFELVAVSFAVQDMRDRRRGHASWKMRGATYFFLAVSCVVNGIVGWISYGPVGLIGVVPPIALGAVIHIHGDRATMAYHSQAKTRPGWRRAHLEKARTESVLEVLPLLTGKDKHGLRSADLLKRRMESDTLTPGDALISAGWSERRSLGLTGSEMRHLEIVAATVWGTSPPLVRYPAATSPVRVAVTPPHPAAAPRRALTASAPTGPAATPPPRAITTPPTPPRHPAAARQATPPELAAIVAEVRADKPTAGEAWLKDALAARGLTAPRAQLRAALKQTPPPSTGTDSGPADATRTDRVDS